ncbi:MAG: isochorismate synthase [Melioribacteraceae bacterium]|nr:isochorismate synthase [Melioribacteraceae bacterium]
MKRFLEKIEHFIKSNSIQNKTLSSLAFDIEDIDFSSILNNIQNRKELYFYTTNVKEDISFLGFDSIFQVQTNGNTRLEDTTNEITKLEKDFCSNWSDFNLHSVPLFLGGMKFSINYLEGLWSDFSDSEWFIPKFLFFEFRGKPYLVYNFFGNKASKDEINRDFELLNSLLKLNHKKRNEPGRIVISSNGKEKEGWVRNINKALEEIDSGKVQKIVLSRQIDMELETNIDISNILRTLGERYPRCYVFAFRKNDSIFFGASPEKLAKISNGWIEADALAGSVARGETEEKDEHLANSLLNSQKDLAEQQIVVSFIRDSFSKFCNEIVFDDTPIIRKLPNIQHLWTPIKGKINSEQSVFTILKELHPTPAICGVPWNKALDSIREMEPHDRGLFSGMVGWFNFNNEGEFAVAIRSALLKKKSIYAFAGCGIVKGSEPEFEYAESELKLKPILSLFETKE